MSQTMSQFGVWLGTFMARSTGNSCSELTAYYKYKPQTVSNEKLYMHTYIHYIHTFNECPAFTSFTKQMTADQLAQLVEHRTTVREVAGSNPGRTNTKGLKITKEIVLPL